MIRLKVKEYAEAKGFTQGKLARKADVDDKTMSKIFHNPHRYYPGTDTLDRIAQVLNIDISCLIENDPPLPKKTTEQGETP